jgi:hypothetical protein
LVTAWAIVFKSIVGTDDEEARKIGGGEDEWEEAIVEPLRKEAKGGIL